MEIAELNRAARLLSPLVGADDQLLVSFSTQPWLHYTVRRKKKPKGGYRLISEPCEPLKEVQSRLLRTALKSLEAHPAAHCRRRASTITNAQAHAGHRYVARFDIKDCFPSVSLAHVKRALARAGLNPAITSLVASLVTFKGGLPQGAPTSMAILNAVLAPIDGRLSDAALAHGVTYTRYVDDICVSGNTTLGFFERAVRLELANVRLKLSPQKTRYWRPGRTPVVAGIAIGRTLRAQPTYLRKVRKLLDAVVQSGAVPSEALMKTVRGHIAYMLAVDPRLGRRYQRRLIAVGIIEAPKA
jgi:hypothetical protein